MPKPSAGLPLSPRGKCPIANALDVVGDKWTLLVIRDLLFFRKVRYNELARSAEDIPTNLLADRLRRLEEAGIIQKKAYQARPPRHEYHLTPRGKDLLPILREMAAWSNSHIPGTGKPPAGFFDNPGVVSLPAAPASGRERRPAGPAGSSPPAQRPRGRAPRLPS